MASLKINNEVIEWIKPITGEGKTETGKLITLTAWLITIFIIFPPTINYIASQYPINPETHFYTVTLATTLILPQ